MKCQRSVPMYVVHVRGVQCIAPCFYPVSPSPVYFEDSVLLFHRGDFPVLFGQQANVFTLLETACLELSVMATKQHKLLKSEDGSPEHLVYKRMVWGMLLSLLVLTVISVSVCLLIVSVALKCHSEAGAVTTSVADIWNRHFVQVCCHASSYCQCSNGHCL